MNKDDAKMTEGNLAARHRYSAEDEAGKLPGPQGQRSLHVFAHGSLEAKVYAVRPAVAVGGGGLDPDEIVAG
jgi:hypothetical protein